jgi:Tol biopolymer transport system component
MNRSACLPALRQTLRFCGVLLAAIALVTPLAFAGVNRWTTSAVQAIPRASGSPAAVDWGKIAFVSSRDGNPEIYTINTDGTNLTRLTNDPAVDEEPAWSPDGQQIAFVSERSGDSELYVMNADGSDVVRRTFSGRFTQNPSWSPDGTKIVYSALSNGSANLWVVSPNAGGPGSTLLFEAPGWDAQPSWSPDGTKLALVSDWNAYDFVWDIFLINADGSGFTGLTGDIFDHVDYLGPSWSPNGATIAHVVNERIGLDQYITTLAVMNADGTGETRLISACSECGGFISVNNLAKSSWSPDGQVIAFTSGTTNALNVSWVAADRSASGVIVSNGWNPSWRPVGSGAQDLSVGTDNRTRLLFIDLDNRAGFRSFDNSGSSTSSSPHGPYSGWNARAVADGSDGLTRVLWSHFDGSVALWLLGPTGNLASSRYGPVAGWTAVDVSVGPDDRTHILWTNTDGRMGLWSLNGSGSVVSAASFGPYSGWIARSISDGPDGLTRVLWSKNDGSVGLSLIGAGGIVATYRFAGEPGWSARDIAVGSDNQTRILRANADGRVVLWSVDNSGTMTNAGTVYGPPVSGQAATRISAGADGLTRVLWTSPVGTGTLWLMGLDNVRQSSFGFGPN